jgi:hypothetical protein
MAGFRRRVVRRYKPDGRGSGLVRPRRDGPGITSINWVVVRLRSPELVWLGSLRDYYLCLSKPLSSLTVLTSYQVLAGGLGDESR